MDDTIDETQQIEAGRARLDDIIRSFDDARLRQIREADYADRVRQQPWLVAGVSDGMGLHTILAAIEAGLLQQGVGVYYEPPTLLEREEGEPVSPVHWARYQNALALEDYAAERGVDLTVLSADMILAPRRGLKGDPKGEPDPVPEEVREAFESARRQAECPDAVFIDSVAFGKWICPREGEEPVEVPNVDFEGRIVRAETKKYHPRGYQETLDTMGRNHGRLLERFREFGWFGSDSITTFFTWAGGSQHVEVLEGIYGRGSLGDAKIIAERDVAEFRLEHGTELGAHGIVRFPAFLSAALMAIPGGGLFGLVSRRLLEARSVHRDIPELASEMLVRLFGREWVRENPIAQIELDSAESLYMSDIAERVEEAHERIEDFRATQEPDARREPIDLETSRELLSGLVPRNYTSILSRFRPDEEDEETDSSAETRTFEIETSPLPTRTHVWAEAGGALRTLLETCDLSEEPTRLEDESTFQVDPRRVARPLRGTVDIEELGDRNGRQRVTCRREIRDASGEPVAIGRTTLIYGSTTSDRTEETLGTPIGYRREFDAPFLREFTGSTGTTDVFTHAVALTGFAEAAMREAGLLGRIDEGEGWSVELNREPEPGDRLLTYVRADDELEASVVDDEGETLLTLQTSS